MKILVCVGKQYGSDQKGVEPMYLEFTRPLVRLGHWVDHFDHCKIMRESSAVQCGEIFLEKVRLGGFDLVLYQTAGREWMPMEAIQGAGRYCPIVAWNSDDDWQWDSVTSKQCAYFTYMVTTYKRVWEENKLRYPNLLLSQWGCLADYAERWREKTIEFSFAGYLYGTRLADARYLASISGLQVRGPGATAMQLGLSNLRGIWRVPLLYGRSLSFVEVNEVWNSSKISWTPMSASLDSKILQIKSRTFEMGLSGSLMLCQKSPGLDEFYVDGKEYVSYESLADCVEKAAHYIKNDKDRGRIANNYYLRTQSEHLWEHRFAKLFEAIF